MTAVLPETIEHLDFALHCMARSGGDACPAKPTHRQRVIEGSACRHAPPTLLCTPHAAAFWRIIARYGAWTPCPLCGACMRFEVVPL